MTTRGEVDIKIGADVSGAFRGINRLFDHAEQRARQLDARVGGIGSGIGRNIGRGGGALGGVGQIALGGFGGQAGFALVEQLIERVLELFEDTELLENFSNAMEQLFEAFGPVVGVLLDVFTPILLALVPVFDALVPAITPLIELLGFGLLTAVLVLTPIIEVLARWFGVVARAVRDFIGGALVTLVNLLNLIPGINIDTTALEELIDGTDRLAESQRQLAEVQMERAEEEERKAARDKAELDRLKERERIVNAALSRRFDPTNIPLSLLETGAYRPVGGGVTRNPAFGPDRQRPTSVIDPLNRALLNVQNQYENVTGTPVTPISVFVQLDGRTISRTFRHQDSIRRESGFTPTLIPFEEFEE